MISKAQRKALFHLPDIYIISYPKSGRTWLRFLLGKWLSIRYQQPEELIPNTSYLSALCHLPVVAFNHDDTGIELKKSYKDLRADKSPYRDKRIVLLARDIRDTLVSAYFHATRRDSLFEGSLSQFIRSPYFGAGKILTFYRYWWMQQTIPRKWLTIYYEDMVADPAAVLTRVLHFIGIKDVPPEIADRAVAYASFENMRKMEFERRFACRVLQPGNVDDPQSFKVRRGRIGGYADYLSIGDIDYLRTMQEQCGCAFTRFPECRSAKDSFAEISTNGNCNIPQRRLTMMEAFRKVDFDPYLHETFTVHSEISGKQDVILVELTEKKSPELESFSLIFKGCKEKAMSQKLYTISHPQMGEFQLFMVPVQYARQDGIYYQSIFNRFVEK